MSSGSAAALMDRIYRPQRLIYDLTRKYYLLGRDRMIEALAPGAGDRVLEIGCGTARNLIVAARRYEQAQFFGIDLSAVMLQTARRSIARAGLIGRVRLARADATEFQPVALFSVPAFERVMLSYCISMVPDWRGALQAAADATAPGGTLHVVDFGMLERWPSWCRVTLHGWLSAFHVTPRAELEPELRRLAAAIGGELLFGRPYGGYAQAAMLRRPSVNPVCSPNA